MILDFSRTGPTFLDFLLWAFSFCLLPFQLPPLTPPYTGGEYAALLH